MVIKGMVSIRMGGEIDNRSLSDGIIEELVALKLALQAANIQAQQIIQAVNAGDLN